MRGIRGRTQKGSVGCLPRVLSHVLLPITSFQDFHMHMNSSFVTVIDLSEFAAIVSLTVARRYHPLRWDDSTKTKRKTKESRTAEARHRCRGCSPR